MSTYRFFALVASQLLISIVPLGTAPRSSASTVYDIVPSSVAAPDYIGSGSDNVSGTIVTDGTFGSLKGHILGGSITLTNSTRGSYTGTLTSWNTNWYGDLWPNATPTQITLPFFGDIVFQASTPSSCTMKLGYSNDGSLGSPFLGSVLDSHGTGLIGFASYWNGNISSSSDPWIIATAQPTPEPATLALLGMGLAGLAGVLLFQRRRIRTGSVG